MHNSIEPTNCIQRLKTLPNETQPPYNWQEFQRRARRRSEPEMGATNWRPLAAAAALLLFVCAIAIWGRFGAGGRHLVADSGAVEDGVMTQGHGAGPTDGASRWWRAQANRPGASMGGSRGGDVSGSERAASAADRASSDIDRKLPGADRETWAEYIVTPGDDHGAPAANRGTLSAEREAAGGDAGDLVADRGTQPNNSTESSIAANRSHAIESWLATLPREPAIVRVGTRAAVAGLEDRIAQVDDLVTSMRIAGTRPDRVAALQQERLRLVGSLAQVRYAEVVASRSP